MIVKKYSNRRLYDTEESRYVTLEELADKIQRGADVRVEDAKTGADLTQSTLTQIILESRRGARLLPVPLLVQLIRMREEALAEFFGRYMSWALELYVQAKQGAQSVAPYNPLASAPFSATNALARLFMGGSPWSGSSAPEAPPAPAAPLPAASSDVADLRRELDELKRAMRPKKSARRR